MCEINSNLKRVSVWNIHMITLLFPWTKLCDWQAECYLHNLKEGLIPGSENLLIVFWYLYPTEVFVHKTTITKGQLQVLHLNNFNSFSAETCSQLHQQSYVFLGTVRKVFGNEKKLLSCAQNRDEKLCVYTRPVCAVDAILIFTFETFALMVLF